MFSGPVDQIQDAFKKADAIIDRPVILLAKTLPGKGVSFMEGTWKYHVWRGENELADLALKELI